MISSSENRVSYNGDGMATEFAYQFVILDRTDMKVLLVAPNGTETLLSKNYYVDMKKNVVLYPGYAPGAELPESERPPILPVGWRLVLYRDVPITQLSRLPEFWPFNVIESMADKLTIICQQLYGNVKRCIKISNAEDADKINLTMPLNKDEFIKVNQDGTGFETEPYDRLRQDATAAVNETVKQDVKDYIEAHPEYVTTVMPESVDEPKLAPALAKKKASWYQSVADMKADRLLKAGMTACTLGYYTPNDGGGANYLIREKTDADDAQLGASVHQLSNGLVAELIIENGTVNIKQFGAKGDGVTDDTPSFKNALATKRNILLNEGTYLITETLYVNVSKQWFRGVSSRAIIKSACGQDVDTIVFHSSSDDNYDNREKRTQWHGSFSIIGQREDLGATEIPNGVRFGGASGTSYEGTLEGNTFRDIQIKWVYKAIVLGNHVYKDIFENIVIANRAAYSIYSEKSEVYDTGECIIFTNCAFWGGCVHTYTRELTFLNCTFHFGNAYQQTLDDGTICGHYFDSCNEVNFQNCHFEEIVYNNEQAISNCFGPFYIKNTTVFMRDCHASITPNKAVTDKRFISDGFIKTVSINNIPTGCFIDGGNWKYLFGRITSDGPLFIGNIIFKPRFYKRTFDSITFPIPMSDKTKPFYTDVFDVAKITNPDKATATISKNDDGVSMHINITPSAYVDNREFFYLRKIDLKDYSMVNVKVKCTGSHGLVQLNPNNKKSCLYFVDENDNLVSYNSGNANSDTGAVNTNNANNSFLRTYAVPTDAKYAYYGIYGWTSAVNASTITNIDVEAYFEFM